MIYKANGDNINGKVYFTEWKQRISFLAENIPQVPEYAKLNKIDY